MRHTQVRALKIGVAAILALVACASQRPGQASGRAVGYATFSPDAAPYKTYPIDAAFSPTGPHLTSRQRAWIVRIVRSKTFERQRLDLYFAIISFGNIPIVVYVNTPKDRNSYGSYGGQVIGAECNILFDPRVHGIFTGPICGPPLPTPTPF
jgi:hypothetical protein